MRIVYWISVLALVLPAPVASQQPVQPSPSAAHAFVSGGLGTGARDIGDHLSISVGRGNRDVILRMAEAFDFEIFATSWAVRDIALLYGWRRPASRGWLRGALGIGHVRTGEMGECLFFCTYPAPSSTTMGLALQGDATWSPIAAFGLGVTLFGNLNADESFGAATVSLHVGRVR